MGSGTRHPSGRPVALAGQPKVGPCPAAAPVRLRRRRRLPAPRSSERGSLRVEFTDAEEAHMGAGRNGVYISSGVILIIVILLVIVFLL
jgi:hypothetical protein